MTRDIVSGEENRVYCLFVPTPMTSVNTGDLRQYQSSVSSQRIYDLYTEYRSEGDFVGMDMCRKFLEMGFTRALADTQTTQTVESMMQKETKPQEKDWKTSEKAISKRLSFVRCVMKLRMILCISLCERSGEP